MSPNRPLAVAVIAFWMLAMYGWLRLCDYYIDPFIRRIMRKRSGQPHREEGTQ